MSVKQLHRVRARQFYNATYIRKEDLVAWFQAEIRALEAQGNHMQALQMESVLSSLRMI